MKADDIYKEIEKDIEKKFDTSNMTWKGHYQKERTKR